MLKFCQFCDLESTWKGLWFCVSEVKRVVQSQGKENVNQSFQDLFLSAQWGLYHFGLCTQVIRALTVRHSAVLLAEVSFLNPGQGVLEDLAATAEITCKSMTLDLSFDCFLFDCSLFKIFREAVLVFWLLPLCLPTCLSFLYFCLKLCLFPKFVKFKLPDCSCLCWDGGG